MIFKSIYVIRLDDICPQMDWQKFIQLKKILDRYKVKPLVGVIPQNLDKNLIRQRSRKDFWLTIRQLSNHGWTVAQHGYQHKYVNSNGGILQIRSQSEFAGLSYAEQCLKISRGQKILKIRLDRNPIWWMSPSHSFDLTTCRVLKDLNFKYISDGLALYPFRKEYLIWLPQQLWQPMYFPFGVWTICIHPNTIDPPLLKNLEMFLKKHRSHIVSPEIALEYTSNLWEPMINGIFALLWRIIYSIKPK